MVNKIHVDKLWDAYGSLEKYKYHRTLFSQFLFFC